MTGSKPRTMTPFAWAVVVVGVFGFVGAVFWLAQTPAPESGSALGDNPAAAIIAIASLLTAIFTPIVNNLVAVRKQVQNSHETNLRDDLDDKHDETSSLLRQILATQKEHGGAIVGIRQDLRQLRVVDRDTGRDVAEVRGTVQDLDKKLDEHLEWSREYVQNTKEKP